MIHAGQCITGDQVGAAGADNVGDCCHECATFPTCTNFTFNHSAGMPNGGICTLHTAATTITVSPSCITGATHATPPGPAPPPPTPPTPTPPTPPGPTPPTPPGPPKPPAPPPPPGPVVMCDPSAVPPEECPGNKPCPKCGQKTCPWCASRSPSRNSHRSAPDVLSLGIP